MAYVGIYRGKHFGRAVAIARNAVKRVHRGDLHLDRDVAVVVDQLSNVLRKIRLV